MMSKRRPYEFLNHTADMGLRSYGESLAEVFANAAKGMFHLITDRKPPDSNGEVREIRLEASDREDLFVSFLNELLYLWEVEGLLTFKVDFREISDRRLRAMIYALRPSVSFKVAREIKAVTFHGLSVTDKVAQVLFDL